MPDFVRAVNTGTKPFSFHANNVKKVIPPGKELMLPWGLAATLFGDPFLQDLPKKPDRTSALRNARNNFNYELGMETEDAFNARRPQIECYDMETGQRIYMLIDDPDGEHKDSYIAPEAESTDQITLLQRQVQALTEQLGVLINTRIQETPEMSSGQTATTSIDAPESFGLPVVNDGSKRAEFVDGNPFAQRDEDLLTKPLFDFAAISQSPIATEDVPADPGVAPATDDKPKTKLARKS